MVFYDMVFIHKMVEMLFPKYGCFYFFSFLLFEYIFPWILLLFIDLMTYVKDKRIAISDKYVIIEKKLTKFARIMKITYLCNGIIRIIMAMPTNRTICRFAW